MYVRETWFGWYMGLWELPLGASIAWSEGGPEPPLCTWGLICLTYGLPGTPAGSLHSLIWGWPRTPIVYTTVCLQWWLTHWGRATHICVGKLTIIGSDNGLSPGRRQAIIWTIAGILLIGSLGRNFGEILIGIQTFSFKKIHLKMSSVKWRPFVSASMC